MSTRHPPAPDPPDDTEHHSHSSEGSPVRRLDRLAYLLLAVFALVTLGPALVGRGALIDLNALTTYMPFRALSGRATADTIVCRWDTLDFYLPGIAAIKAGLLEGDVPTWAPYEVGGAPLAALPNHAALSPLSLPYFLLPLWLAPAFVKLAEFAVGIGGMFAFLRLHGLSRGSSIIAGIVFVSSGFMIMWSNWPHTKVAALIPVLFWALERLVQRRRARDIVLIGAVVASMLFGGFPAVTLYALTLGAGYVAMRVFVVCRGDLRAAVDALSRAAAGVGLGIGLAALQVVPFASQLEALGLADRQQASSGQHLPLGLFLTTAAPDAVGTCVNGEAYAATNPIESVGFIGAAAMLLAVLAIAVRVPRGVPGRSLQSFLTVALPAVVIAIWVGGPLLSALQSLPFYSANFIGRAQSIFGFLAAALVGIGVEQLLRSLPSNRAAPSPPASRRQRLARASRGVLVLVLVLVLATAVLHSAFADAEARDYSGYLASALLVPGLLLVGGAGALALTWYGPAATRVLGPVLLALLIVGQSTAFAHTLLPLSDRANLYPLTPTHAFLKSHLGGDRYAAGDRTMYSSTSDYYELRTPDGHQFTDPRWRDLLVAVDPDAANHKTMSRFTGNVTLPQAARSAVLDQLSVRYWVSAPERVLGRTDALTDSGERVSLARDEPATCTVRGGALRGVSLFVAQPRRVPVADRMLLHVRVRTPDGVREGSQLLRDRVRRGARRVAVPAEDVRSGRSSRVRVWVTGKGGDTAFRASDGRLDCAAVRPQDDGVRLAFTEAGANTYERLGALPRVRWASDSEVVREADDRVRRLASGIPGDTVLLDDDSTPPAQGAPAQLHVVRDRPERISTDVDAAGGGYLVVADALVRRGWVATVDGRRTAMVHANHALTGVPVPAGRHRVELSYTAPGLRLGAVISAVSGGVAVVLLLLPPWRARRRVDRAGPGTRDKVKHFYGYRPPPGPTSLRGGP